MLPPKGTVNRQQTTVTQSFVALLVLWVQERGLRSVGASPLAQKTVRKLPFPRVLLLQGGSLTGLVCTAMQADAPASLPTPIFFTVCFASPKNRLYSAQPPLGRTLDEDVWTMDIGRESVDESARCSVVLAYSSVSQPVKAEMYAVSGLDRPGKEESPVANRATAAEWYVLG
ncbi:hypothetical protein SDC9_132803 [bioreactor metagenome]|uniref:Uncharacterized protein n=1 Tax=bioreactor metagenome TaxID=1076179 RepID=A0A645DAW5_9ZZZZ